MTKDTQTHTTSSRRSFKQFSFKDRQLIECLFRKKAPVPLITRELGFYRSSIYRELKCGPDLNIASNHALALFLRSLIRNSKMSPYAAFQIAKRKHDDVPVCSRTLYHYIDRFNFLSSPSDLVHGPRRSRRKPILKRLSRTNLKGQSMDVRPAFINNRSE